VDIFTLSLFTEELNNLEIELAEIFARKVDSFAKNDTIFFLKFTSLAMIGKWWQKEFFYTK
jgi:hypothetical protein